MGFALDAAAFTINAAFALAADIAFLAGGGPKAYGVVAGLYRIVAPIPTLMGLYGGVLWSAEGAVLGDTYGSISGTLSPNLLSNELTTSVTYSQDTAVSAVLDVGGLAITDPNIAAIASGVGAIYDVARSPASPFISSRPPLIPSVIAPTYSVSIDLSSPMPISHGWSPFAP